MVKYAGSCQSRKVWQKAVRGNDLTNDGTLGFLCKELGFYCIEERNAECLLVMHQEVTIAMSARGFSLPFLLFSEAGHASLAIALHCLHWIEAPRANPSLHVSCQKKQISYKPLLIMSVT
jgi:hypothetical protein